MFPENIYAQNNEPKKRFEHPSRQQHRPATGSILCSFGLVLVFSLSKRIVNYDSMTKTNISVTFLFSCSFMFPFKIPSLNVGRYGHCAVSCEGSIYTFGGRTSGYECISELELYGQDGWTSLNEVNLLPRYHLF